jgi:hypothetical protein
VRYEQDRFHDRDGDQPGGYLVAIDLKTGARLWRLKVYAIDHGPGAPTGGARFFGAMHVGADGRSLDIVDEFGFRFRVDLADRTVTALGRAG